MQPHSKTIYRYSWFSGVILLLCSGCIKNLTIKQEVYFNDFNKGYTNNLEIYNINGGQPWRSEVFNGSAVLGRFNNNAVLLILPALPRHNTMEIEFTLYIHDKWTGNKTGPGGVPDLWQMQVDNNPLLITTFSNLPGIPQSFPEFYKPTTLLPAKMNAADTSSTLGACALQNQTGGTTIYHIVKSVPHSASQFILTLSDALQPYNSLCEKSWSIDDLRVTAITY